jgi:hypothetical protein
MRKEYPHLVRRAGSNSESRCLVKKKVSEAEFKDFCKRRGIYWHKFADILQCPVCANTIWQSHRMPDFEITYLGTKTLVEVKQGSGKYGVWNFADPEKGIRDIQREVMDEWEDEQGVMPWLFLVLGAGRAPDGRGAFLIPWDHWKQFEDVLLDEGQKSIRFQGGRMLTAVELLKDYRMAWIKGTDDSSSGWDLPWGHPFQSYLHAAEAAHEYRRTLEVSG